MGILIFILYVVVEVAVVVAVGQAIGAVWTALLLIAGSAVGMLLVGSQWRRVMNGLRAAANGDRSPDGAVADGVLVAIGSVLMFVPGFVTSVLGLLLLLPPTRFVVRPLVVLFGARRYARMVADAKQRNGIVDGEVVSTWYEDSPSRALDSGTGWERPAS